MSGVSKSSRVICYLLTFLAVGCMNIAIASNQNGMDELREAVYRWQLNKLENGDNKLTFCLEVENGNHDPSTILLNKLSGDKFRVTMFSGCRSDEAGVTEVKTGNEAIILFIKSIRRRSRSDAIVEGGYFRNGKWGAESQYDLVFDGSHWVVTKEEEQLEY